MTPEELARAIRRLPDPPPEVLNGSPADLAAWLDEHRTDQ